MRNCHWLSENDVDVDTNCTEQGEGKKVVADPENSLEEGDSSKSEGSDNHYKNMSMMKSVGLVILGLVILFLTGFIVYEKLTGNETVLMQHSEPEKLIGNYKNNTEKVIINQNPPKLEETCTTDVCAEAAVNLLNRINTDVKPCDDFFDHACGKFTENTYLSIPGMTDMHGLGLKMNKIYKKVLDSNKTETKSEEIMKFVRKQCLEASSQNSSSDKRRLQVLNELSNIGKWPIIDRTWTESDFDLTQFLINYSKKNSEKLGFFVFASMPASGVRNVSKVTVMEPMKKYKKEYSDSYETVERRTENYFKIYSDIVSFVKPEFNISSDATGTIKKDIEDVIKFEKVLERAINDNDVNSIGDYAALKRWIPVVDWDRLTESMMEKNPEKLDILRNKIFALQSDYFEIDIHNVLTETRPRVLANYLIFQWISDLRTYMPLEIENIFQIDEDQDIKLNNEKCTDIVMRLFPLNYVMAFAYRYIEFENIEGVTKMVEEIKQEFIEMVNQTNWMDEESKRRAIKKIEKIEATVTYPKEFNDTEKLEKRYEKMKIDRNADYFGNLMATLEWQVDTFWNDLLDERDNYFWHTFYNINAYYTAQMNSLTIESPFLRMPVYDSNLPSFYNLGMIGNTIGHEMGHGFDNNWIYYDENGNYETGTYTHQTMQKFEEIQKCFIDKYSSYKHPRFQNKQIRGDVSVNENIADYTGMQLTYRLMKKQEIGSKLPGLQQYNQMKLFFYNYASIFCNVPLNIESFDNANNVVHGFNRFRVNGVLSNFDGFSEVFGCKKGSKMNPVDKCSLY